MSDLPRIPSPEPIIIPGQPAVPEVPEQQFNDLYIIGLNLMSQAATQQRLVISFCPYDYTSKTFPTTWNDPKTQVREVIQNVWVEAARNPSFAQAMGAVLQASTLIVQERALIEQIAQAIEADKPALQVQLDALHVTMGIAT